MPDCAREFSFDAGRHAEYLTFLFPYSNAAISTAPNCHKDNRIIPIEKCASCVVEYVCNKW
jgi:hypothetical protein